MNISLSLPHLVHFRDGVGKEETRFTSETTTLYLQKSWIAAGWMLEGGRGKARGARHVPCGTFSTPFSLKLSSFPNCPSCRTCCGKERGIWARVSIYDSAKLTDCFKLPEQL